MTDNELMLEILKRVQADTADIKRRLESADTRLAAHDEHLTGLLIAAGGIQSELRGLNARVERIERRLDLVNS